MTSEFLRNFEYIRITRYARIASSTIIFYDHGITMSEEVELFWKSKLSLVAVLFFANRYVVWGSILFDLYAVLSPNVTDVVSSVCTHYYQWESWSLLLASMLAQAILQARVYALYMLNKKILALMLVCYSTCSIICAWLTWTELESLTIKAIPIPGGKYCTPSQSVNFFSFWIPVLIFDFLLFSLAVFRGLAELKSDGSGMLRDGTRSLFGIMVRDSVFYFLVLAAIYLTIILFWLLAPVGLREAPVSFCPVLSCVLTNRVLFNLRKAIREDSQTDSQ
ncbi:hypothetical protein GALMADRAFT_256020 [Galerina marginata CBS 339.88]|uniref:DUF6533 domain-containing protein n=1 Tax=Galerina marginata (strain CBS 339.88) TaxID=685588 RepID=A0A067SN90_GALM3|nr:hypothetical protein GALMADRAFT_256020 [Galerina marginata CBS 339.88]